MGNLFEGLEEDQEYKEEQERRAQIEAAYVLALPALLGEESVKRGAPLLRTALGKVVRSIWTAIAPDQTDLVADQETTVLAKAIATETEFYSVAAIEKRMFPGE